MIAILEAKRAGLLSKAHWVNNILAGTTTRYGGIESLQVATLMAGVI